MLQQQIRPRVDVVEVLYMQAYEQIYLVLVALQLLLVIFMVVVLQVALGMEMALRGA
jgi:hypothetical protein